LTTVCTGIVGLLVSVFVMSLNIKSLDFFGRFLFYISVVWLAASIELVDNAKVGKKLRWLGDMSYGMYLWHVPVQISLLLWLKYSGIGQWVVSSKEFFACFFLLVFTIAYVSFRCFELPMRLWIRGFVKT
jgi:peptidoglycan/LPS O-acetylase OafA/YrhL